VIRLAALGVAWLGGFGVASAGAQTPRASTAVTAMVVGSDPVFVGAGLSFAHPVSGCVRLRSLGMVGRAGQQVMSRLELLLELVLDPRNSGWTPFAGGGVAGQVGFGADRKLQGRLVVLVGVEQGPAASRGWRLEAGLGGGVRVAAGYRFRL
jgi:hypothetical protein